VAAAVVAAVVVVVMEPWRSEAAGPRAPAAEPF
jgi:hypothetical protein